MRIFPIISRLLSIAVFIAWTAAWPLAAVHAQEPPPNRPSTPVRSTTPVRPGNPVQPTTGSELIERRNVASGKAHIQLSVKPSNIVYWTELEWEDSEGMWRPVDGWQGHTNNGSVRWVVAPPQYGHGPFRWQVHTADKERLIMTSGEFFLPAEPLVTVYVELQIAVNKSGE